jgi:hypothetical protein
MPTNISKISEGIKLVEGFINGKYSADEFEVLYINLRRKLIEHNSKEVIHNKDYNFFCSLMDIVDSYLNTELGKKLGYEELDVDEKQLKNEIKERFKSYKSDTKQS